jgi:hypothetical protein
VVRGLSCAAISCACSGITAVGKVSGDAGRPERVIADRRVNAGGDSAPADHAPRVQLTHRLFG